MKLYTRAMARAALPSRQNDANKSDGGRALIVAGSEGMLGAAVLSATAAARVGAGYVTLLTDLKKFSSCRHPDFLTADSRRKKITDLKFSAAAIGPGLGTSRHSLKLLRDLIRSGARSVVIDADALNLCAQQKLLPLPPTWIATPHEGELARLLNITAQKIKSNRPAAARAAQKKLNCIVVLKGSRTLIATAQGIIQNSSGNAALAKAGTGDVLTGIICGFLAQGLEPPRAACLGAFLHGDLADDWIKAHDVLSLLASDLLASLPAALLRMRNVRRGRLRKFRGTPLGRRS